MSRSRIAFESWICCEEKRPSLRKSSFTHKKAIEIAIINVLIVIISVIFITFAGAKITI